VACVKADLKWRYDNNIHGHRDRQVARAKKRTTREIRARNIARYGLSIEAHDSLLATQNNCCAICEGRFTKPPHVDHCHKTGEVRGLLCSNCNTGIGNLRDDPALLRKALEYLTKLRVVRVAQKEK
jgi:recombination endonuclease VII